MPTARIPLGRLLTLCAVASAVAIPVACTAPGIEENVAPEEPSAAALDAAADAQAVLQAHERLRRSFEESDSAALGTLLDNSPNLMLFHPSVRDRFDGIESVRPALNEMFTRKGERDWQESHPFVQTEGDVGWVTSQFLVTSPGLPQPVMTRGTEIWHRRDGQWKLVHGHWSRQP